MVQVVLTTFSSQLLLIVVYRVAKMLIIINYHAQFKVEMEHLLVALSVQVNYLKSKLC